MSLRDQSPKEALTCNWEHGFNGLTNGKMMDVPYHLQALAFKKLLTSCFLLLVITSMQRTVMPQRLSEHSGQGALVPKYLHRGKPPLASGTPGDF